MHPSETLVFPAQGFWAQTQSHLIHRIKKNAVKLLHKSLTGEVFLLHLYDWGETATELSLPDSPEVVCANSPAWLLPQLKRHLADEQRHSQMLQDRIALLTANQSVLKLPDIDKLSRKKLQTIEALEPKWAPRFKEGTMVVVYAVAWCGEQMATRILARHLEQLPSEHALVPLLSQILFDEAHHVHLCEQTLARLVNQDEQPALNDLLNEILRIERHLGITSTIGLWFLGGYYWLKTKLKLA